MKEKSIPAGKQWNFAKSEQNYFPTRTNFWLIFHMLKKNILVLATDFHFKQNFLIVYNSKLSMLTKVKISNFKIIRPLNDDILFFCKSDGKQNYEFKLYKMDIESKVNIFFFYFLQGLILNFFLRNAAMNWKKQKAQKQ